MSYQKKASAYDPYLKDQGIDWLAGAGKAGLNIASFSVISAGSPDAVLLSTYGYGEMADTSYQVFVDGETTNPVHADESTKTVAGFTILGGVAAEVMHVLVIGRLKGQPAS